LAEALPKLFSIKVAVAMETANKPTNSHKTGRKQKNLVKCFIERGRKSLKAEDSRKNYFFSLSANTFFNFSSFG